MEVNKTNWVAKGSRILLHLNLKNTMVISLARKAWATEK